MRRFVWQVIVTIEIVIFLFAGLICPTANSQTLVAPPVIGSKFFSDDSPLRLVLQLGSADHRQRQRAIDSLCAMGIDAFDIVFLSQQSSDREIALQSQRIIRKLRIQDELEAACPTLAGFRQLDFSGRAKKVIQMGRSTSVEDLIGLCLVARFDEDEVLSRWAAVELITRNPNKPAEFISSLGHSRRTACQWIRGFVKVQSNPQQLVDLWQPIINSISDDQRLTKRCPEAMVRLMRWYAERLLTMGDSVRANRVAKMIEQILPQRFASVITQIDWLMLHRLSALCDDLATRYPELFQQQPLLKYRMAELAWLDDRNEDASSMARQASEAVGEDPMLHIQCALNLESSGLVRWAARELETVVGNAAGDSSVRTQAAILLAEMRFQQGEFQSAADAISEALRFANATDEHRSVILIHEDKSKLIARRHFFLHQDYMQLEQLDRAKEHLILGLEHSQRDSELLIAMTRLPGQELEWESAAGELVNLALDSYRQEIDKLSELLIGDSHSENIKQRQLADMFNRYAWLASQTGVQLLQAEQFSRQAVKIAPSNSFFLDTLAGCLFQRGNLQEALAIQKRAVSTMPHSARLRASMSRYEQAFMFAELERFFR